MTFSMYLQVCHLDRSLPFYRDALGLEVAWKDDMVAVLRGTGDTSATLLLREIGGEPKQHLGEAGVTRIGWQATSSAELDSAEERLAQDRHSRPRRAQGHPVPAPRAIPGRKAASVHLLASLNDIRRRMPVG